MRTLIVGAGALGGLIAARLAAAGREVALATRTEDDAAHLAAHGLIADGVGGKSRVAAIHTSEADVAQRLGDRVVAVASLERLMADAPRPRFELIILATKAHDAVSLAPRLADELLAPAGEGVLLPIQNGDVSRMVAERTGSMRVLAGLSNLGATRHALGRYEQRNAGHLLIGDTRTLTEASLRAPNKQADGEARLGNAERLARNPASSLLDRVETWLEPGVSVQRTTNFAGAVWSKLMLNCAVTTLGAIAGVPMRSYIKEPEARRLFDLVYFEALHVALAVGVLPQRMLVNPIPPRLRPSGHGSSAMSADHSRDDACAGGTARLGGPGGDSAHTQIQDDAWIAATLDAYGDLKPSMLQDFERKQRTEIDFVNGYVVTRGREVGVATPANAAVVALVGKIEAGEHRPRLENLGWLAHIIAQRSGTPLLRLGRPIGPRGQPPTVGGLPPGCIGNEARVPCARYEDAP